MKNITNSGWSVDQCCLLLAPAVNIGLGLRSRPIWLLQPIKDNIVLLTIRYLYNIQPIIHYGTILSLLQLSLSLLHQTGIRLVLPILWLSTLWMIKLIVLTYLFQECTTCLWSFTGPAYTYFWKLEEEKVKGDVL